MTEPSELTSQGCMAVSEVLRSVSHVLRSLLRKPASEGLLLDNYATTCLALDEMIYEVRAFACLPGHAAHHASPAWVMEARILQH